MCRILALAGNFDERKIATAAKKFRPLAHTGCIPKGQPKGHKDGWGAAWYQGARVVVKKYSTDAYSDSRYPTVARALSRAVPKSAIIHVRKASVGKLSVVNTQPLQYHEWIFCHNGTVYQAENFPIGRNFKSVIKGTTDSEKFFLLCMDKVKGATDPAAFRKALKNVLHYIRAHHDYTALNVIFSNGRFMWALREFNEKNAWVKKLHLGPYYSLYQGDVRNCRATVFCSEKLSLPRITWNLIKNHELVEYEIGNGKSRSYKV